VAVAASLQGPAAALVEEVKGPSEAATAIPTSTILDNQIVFKSITLG
jgi:hypothetical protein